METKRPDGATVHARFSENQRNLVEVYPLWPEEDDTVWAIRGTSMTQAEAFDFHAAWTDVEEAKANADRVLVEMVREYGDAPDS